MKKLLSYIYPITRKVSSDFNGELELTWYNGKKHLNTKNANYSYGSLQKILKIGLQNIDLGECKIILILGMGGGSVIKTLRNDFGYKQHITAVEIDPVIINIAKNEFQIYETGQLKIICSDALHFMKHNKRLFDLIIVDLFVDTEVPTAFFNDSFWKNMTNSISHNGAILFNASLHVQDAKKLDSVTNLIENESFKIKRMDKVNQTNTLLIAKKVKNNI